MVKIVNVQVDYQINPIGLADKTPSFSWSYIGDNFHQTFYRVLVATSAENLASNRIDVWDSGLVNSDVSAGIIYQGKELSSRCQYYYQIETNAGKSAINSFETGLLNDKEWIADFIGAPVTRVGGALLVRKDFEIKKSVKVQKARIYICGLGCHEVYVNGHKVSQGILNPPITDYNKTVLYDVYGFEDCLKQGKNALGIILGHGWLGSRKLCAQVYITYENGEEDFFYTTSCADWWMRGAWIVEDSIYDGEISDGIMKRELSSWCDPKTPIGWAEGWLYSLLVEKPQGRLTKNILEPIDEVERFKPVSCKNIKNIKVFDFGQNFSGFVSVRVKGQESSKVIIRYGEQLKENGLVNQLNLRTALARDVYILSGDDEEEYTPRFTYHGFRYAEVEIDGNASLVSIEGIFVRNSVKQISFFECDNEVINKLHKNVLYTEGSNMHGIFTDCPQRDERFGWLNDLTARLHQNVLNYHISNFLSKVSYDIKDTQDKLGRIADTAPFLTAFRPADPVCLSYLSSGLQAYKYYGNKKLLIDLYDGYKRWVDYLSSEVDFEKVTLYARFADWCAPEPFDFQEDPVSKMTSGEFISICFYYLHLKAVSEIAFILNKDDDGKKYENNASLIKKAIVDKYYDSQKNIISSGSQACLAICLGLHLLNDKEETKMADRFNKSIVDKEYHVILGNQTYVYAFDALAKFGYVDTAIKTLVNPTYPGWGFMIANGATTIWERWEKDMQQKMHSFNHPMFGSVDAFLFNDLLGISILDDAVAANKIFIKPYFSSLLNEVKGGLQTIAGEIKLEYKKTNNEIVLDLYLPPNTEARIEINNLYELNGEEMNKNQLNISGGGHYILKAHFKEEE